MKDKAAVSTGGSSGIGLAIAEEFAPRGAKVVITGRRQGALDEAAAGIGTSCSTFKGDVAVVIIGSTRSINPPRGMSMHGGAKAAVRDFVRSWIQDTKGSGIRINVLSPGAVDAESLRSALTRARGAGRVQTEIDRMGAGSPIGRIAQTGEIAKAVAFLASDDSSFIHGVELFADGGLAQV